MFLSNNRNHHEEQYVMGPRTPSPLRQSLDTQITSQSSTFGLRSSFDSSLNPPVQRDLRASAPTYLR